MRNKKAFFSCLSWREKDHETCEDEGRADEGRRVYGRCLCTGKTNGVQNKNKDALLRILDSPAPLFFNQGNTPERWMRTFLVF